MRFLAIGDSCIDKFIYGKCERICPEAPVPVFTPTGATSNGGMAKNVQANVIALGVDCDVITNSNEIEKKRYVDKKTNQMLLRVDVDDRATDFFDYKKVEYDKYDAILVSDYGKGFLPKGVIRQICLEHENVFFDSNKVEISYDLPVGLRFLKINKQELEVNPHLKHHLIVNGGHDSAYTRADQIIVTHGHKGCWYMGKMYTPPTRVVTQDLSGAGDTFLAALAVHITKGNPVEDALKFANRCASEVVGKRGVATV